jgi:hypothetical protein
VLIPGHFSFEEYEAGWEKASPALRAWVDANRPALDRWRCGTEKMSAVDGDLRRLDRVDSLPEVIPAREFSRLACLQGEREKADGHMIEAWQWYRALVRFSRHIAQRKGATGRVVGVAFHAEAATRITSWATDPRTNDDVLTLALNQMTEDFRLTRTFSEALKVEYCDIRRLDLWEGRRQFQLPPFQDDGSWWNSRFALFCRGEPELTFRLHELIVENWLAASDRPRSPFLRITGLKGNLLDLKAPGSGIAGRELLRMLDTSENVSNSLANLSKTRDAIDKELTRHEALRLTLACQIWLRRHGAFPAVLQDLIPDVLPELPVDPFSRSGEGLQYRRDGDEAVIECAGLDEVYDPGVEHSRWREINYRFVPPRTREQASGQKPGDEP